MKAMKTDLDIVSRVRDLSNAKKKIKRQQSNLYGKKKTDICLSVVIVVFYVLI